MRLKASVRRDTGATRHSYGIVEDDAVVGIVAVPKIAWVEIVEDEPGWLLLYFDVEGACLTDTWHQTLADAKEAAREEFEILDADWDPANINPT